ncbi:MAG: alpha/beta hydrolase, partial [Gemmatimonadetes bacterium]|nr:alpha/beta hydrolase [Gemmatimonadota bacterium]
VVARLADLHRIHTPEGIEVLEPVEVNGSTQWISIRGLNRANPILLFVHGGPASPMLGSTWAYQKPWEDFFTVVNWDQRGIGKNYSAADTARLGPTMTRQQHVRDAEVVVRHVLERLGQDKLILMGYSWGTAFTPQLVQERPELFHAWVGVGVVASGGGEAALYARVLELARKANDSTALRELEAMAPYPGPGPMNVERALAVRRWVRRYDGGWYGKPDFDLLFSLNEWGDAYTAEELSLLSEGSRWGTRRITGSGAMGGAAQAGDDFPVPVVFLMGRYDLHTPYESARARFERIRAPSKRFVAFERSSHVVMMEEPGRFLLTLVNEVLPLAGGAAEFEPRPDPVPRR